MGLLGGIVGGIGDVVGGVVGGIVGSNKVIMGGRLKGIRMVGAGAGTLSGTGSGRTKGFRSAGLLDRGSIHTQGEALLPGLSGGAEAALSLRVAGTIEIAAFEIKSSLRMGGAAVGLLPGFAGDAHVILRANGAGAAVTAGFRAAGAGRDFLTIAGAGTLSFALATICETGMSMQAIGAADLPLFISASSTSFTATSLTGDMTLPGFAAEASGRGTARSDITAVFPAFSGDGEIVCGDDIRGEGVLPRVWGDAHLVISNKLNAHGAGSTRTFRSRSRVQQRKRRRILRVY